MVQDNMNDFVDAISNAKADYRVTVLAARTNDPDDNEICVKAPLASSDCSGSGPRFQQINQHVDSHDGLCQFNNHLEAIEGFMRPDSVRHIVMVSDDRCGGTNQGIGCAKETCTAFASLKNQAGFEDYVFHSIVGTHQDRCLAKNGVGSTYMELSRSTGGEIYHICRSNWSPLYARLQETVIRATRMFKLSGRPVGGTINVSIGNQPATEGSRWAYDARANQIVLKGALPEDGTKLSVCYQPR